MAEVPVLHREAIAQALAAAFGAHQVDAIAPMHGGASGAFAYRVALGERNCVVRLEGERSPLRNPHQYQSMLIAADAGIAPRLHHIDAAAGVAVMDFIEETPLADFPGGPGALAQAVGRLIARIQETAPFPPFLDYPEMVRRLWGWVCRTGLFADGVLTPCTDHMVRLCETYDSNPAHAVSSHNDLVPRNVLYDGVRLWLIDWESAYRNHKLVDVSTALDCFARTPEWEQSLLQAWLGSKPDDEFYARLAPIRALTRLYYAGVFLSAAFAGLGALGDRDLDALSVPDFERQLRDGILHVGTPATKLVLGKMYLRSFLIGASPPGLDAAV